LRILHLITELAGGGAERQLSYLAPALVRRGHEVHLGYRHSGDFPPALPGVHLTRFDTRSNYDPRLFAQIRGLMRRVVPDLVQTWILQMDVAGGAVAKLAGIPWVLREPSSAMAYRGGNWKHSLRVQVARSAKAIICNSRGGEEYWGKQLPTSRRFIVPNGLPIAEIDAAVPAARLDVPVVLYVGRLSSDGSATKNLPELMHALAVVREELVIKGVFCGEGPQRGDLVALQQRLGLDGDVVFTGQLGPDAVWALMKSAAVFVSLSAYEGSPNAVMEAMATGCPLVLSDIAAHREIADDQSALFVDPYDRQRTADAIKHVLCNPQSARARAAVARARIEQLSTDRMVDGFERIYEEMR
jgi:glycosyltransferase involved in cell wall biosynthesis